MWQTLVARINAPRNNLCKTHTKEGTSMQIFACLK